MTLGQPSLVDKTVLLNSMASNIHVLDWCWGKERFSSVRLDILIHLIILTVIVSCLHRSLSWRSNILLGLSRWRLLLHILTIWSSDHILSCSNIPLSRNLTKLRFRIIRSLHLTSWAEISLSIFRACRYYGCAFLWLTLALKFLLCTEQINFSSYTIKKALWGIVEVGCIVVNEWLRYSPLLAAISIPCPWSFSNTMRWHTHCVAVINNILLVVVNHLHTWRSTRPLILEI